jgi:hypothetical protein
MERREERLRVACIIWSFPSGGTLSVLRTCVTKQSGLSLPMQATSRVRFHSGAKKTWSVADVLVLIENRLVIRSRYSGEDRQVAASTDFLLR